MFVIQKYLHDRKKKIEAWEESRDRWINEGNGWRSENDYKEKHPRPGVVSEALIKIIPIVAVVALVIFLLVNLIIDKVQASNSVQTKTVSSLIKDGDRCGEFRKGDKVVVQYGDYAETVGTIIGGCRSDEDYQVKLDDKQLAYIRGDGEEGKADVSNKLITVDSNRNLVVIDHAEKK